MSDTLQSVRQRLESEVITLGAQAVGSIYSDIYNPTLLQFELVDASFNTVRTFTFPIRPETITSELTNNAQVRKASDGVSLFHNDGFDPVPITMSGTFGQTFKVIIDESSLELAGITFDFEKGKIGLNKTEPVFSSFAKTGFGCITLLYELFELHRSRDGEGRPYYLILYYGGFKTPYIVSIQSIRQTENVTTNNMGLIRYDMNLIAVAPYNTNVFNDPGRLVNRLGLASIQRVANGIVSDLKRSIVRR